MREAAQALLESMGNWAANPTGRQIVPRYVLDAVAAIESADQPVNPLERQFQDQVFVLAEAVQGTGQHTVPDVGRDGKPGPRLLAAWERVRKLGMALGAMAPAAHESKPQEEAVSEQDEMTGLLDRLQQVKPEDIDRGIAELQERIDRLKQLRRLVAPRTTRPASTGDGEFDLGAVRAWLKDHGPAKPGAIAKQFGVHSTKAAKLLLRADGVKRLGDGRFSVS